MSEFQKRYAPGRLAEDLRRQAPAAPRPAESTEERKQSESVTHLGTLRHRKVRLELRFRDRTAKAINYSDIVLMGYDPEQGISLDLPPLFRVRFQGIALASLYRALVEERVAAVAEVDPFTAAARQDQKPAVVAIAFEKWAG